MGADLEINYDGEFDILHIFKKGEVSKHSIEMFDVFVIDLNFDNKVVGLEILNASKNLKVSSEELENAREAELSTFATPNYFEIYFLIMLPDRPIENRLMVPQAVSLKV